MHNVNIVIELTKTVSYSLALHILEIIEHISEMGTNALIILLRWDIYVQIEKCSYPRFVPFSNHEASFCVAYSFCNGSGLAKMLGKYFCRSHT